MSIIDRDYDRFYLIESPPKAIKPQKKTINKGDLPFCGKECRKTIVVCQSKNACICNSDTTSTNKFSLRLIGTK